VRNPFAEFLGIRVVEVGEGRSRCTLSAVGERYTNTRGVVHGGVTTTLADVAMAVALNRLLAPEGLYGSTLDLKVVLLQPVQEGDLTAEGWLVHRGRTFALMEAQVWQNGQRVAQAMATFAIRPYRREGGEG